MNPDTNPQTGKYYHVYALVYLDDFLHIHHDPEIFIKETKGVCRLKYCILGPPT